MCLEQRESEGKTGESQQLVLQEPSLAFHFILRAEGSHREDSGRGGSDLSLGEAALVASWRSQLGWVVSEGTERPLMRPPCHPGENGACG